MPKFRILIHGENYQIRTQKKFFLFRKQTGWKQVGFYTTRFIESETANEAIERVFKIIDAELQEVGRVTADSTMELSEIQEDENGYDLYAPGGGFTFYTEDEEK